MTIRKPTSLPSRESATAANLRMAAGFMGSGITLVRAGSYVVRGLICWGFALLWGFVALAGGLFGDIATFLGVGTLAAVAAWFGTRLFAKARACRPTGFAAES